MASADQQHLTTGPGRFAALLLDVYQTRVMLALVLSLLLITLCFHVPWQMPVHVIGWQVRADVDQARLTLVDIQPPQPEHDGGGPPATQLPATALPLDEVEHEADETSAEEEVPASSPPPAQKLATRQAVLDFADQPPQIVGGLGAYYIHIQYPEAALEQGIQGRLTLTFVVEPDGRTSDVEVLHSLHPLCDSAAVQALRRTHFAPGQQDGKPTRVRMRLPVVFRIVDPEPDDSMAVPPSNPVARGDQTREEL